MTAWIEALWLALRSISRSALRSSLTVLGILIGIAAVVIVVSLGESARDQVTAQIQSLGSNLIYIFNSSGEGRSGRSERAGQRLSHADAEALRREIPSLRAVTVYSSLKAQVISPYENDEVDVVGADEGYLTVRGYDLVSGRDITREEVKSSAKVALIGQTAARKLFLGVAPVGHPIRIGPHRYRVIGELSPKGFTPFGSDQDDRVVIPISSWQKRVSPGQGQRVDMVIASSPDAASVDYLRDQMDQVMLERHRIPPDGKRDFRIFTQDQFRQTQEEIYGVLSLILISVAGISLFVGGVGVTNVLLVSVTERRREIGTRMAVGARAKDIRRQFLAESMALTTAGGLCGIVLAFFGTRVLSDQLQWPLEINAQSLIVALATSLFLGIVFGLLPAQRAARLDPMDALRHE